jgi:hypothetical protein
MSDGARFSHLVQGDLKSWHLRLSKLKLFYFFIGMLITNRFSAVKECRLFGSITKQNQCPNLEICCALQKLLALWRFSECYKTAKGHTMAIKKHTFHTRFQELITEQMTCVPRLQERPPSSSGRSIYGAFMHW